MSRMWMIGYIFGAVVLLSTLSVYVIVRISRLQGQEEDLSRALHAERRRLWDIPGSNSKVLEMEDARRARIREQVRLARLAAGIFAGVAALSAAVCFLVLG